MYILVSDVVAERYGGRLRAVAPGIEFVQLLGDGSFVGPVEQAEVVTLSVDMFERGLHTALLRILDRLTGMKWFHGFFVGMDHPIFKSIADRGVILTNSPGVTAVPIAQYVLAMMLRHAKRIPQWEAAQRERAWRRVDSDELTGRTVAILGVGGIGTEVARLCAAFGMRVLGIRRTPGEVPHVDAIYPPDRLHEVLGEADYLVITCPLTAQTRGMIDAAALSRLKPSAYLVNIARGPIVVEDALVAALREDRLAGAALDVFDEAPLLADAQL